MGQLRVALQSAYISTMMGRNLDHGILLGMKHFVATGQRDAFVDFSQSEMFDLIAAFYSFRWTKYLSFITKKGNYIVICGRGKFS